MSALALMFVLAGLDVTHINVCPCASFFSFFLRFDLVGYPLSEIAKAWEWVADRNMLSLRTHEEDKAYIGADRIPLIL